MLGKVSWELRFDCCIYKVEVIGNDFKSNFSGVVGVNGWWNWFKKKWEERNWEIVCIDKFFKNFVIKGRREMGYLWMVWLVEIGCF